MKVAVFGQFGWYGTMGTWVADGFEMNGHEVERIDRKDIILLPEKYDLIMHVDCSEDYSSHVTKCKGGVRAFWSMDTHMPGGIERSVNIAKKCDIVFSSNYEAGVKTLEKFGVESYLMPITYNDRLLAKPHKNLDIDIAMIGHENSPERKELFKILNDNYKCFTGKADTEQEYVNIMNSCKMVVNQPTEPWDMILNNRLFEGMGFNKLVLQKRLRTDLIEKLGFVVNEDFVYWENFDDLNDKIKTLLDIYKVRNMMAERGNDKVQSYAMSVQCAKIETIILSKFYDRF